VISVSVTSNGLAGLLELPYTVKKHINETVEAALDNEVRQWKQLVITSTWFHPTPSPTFMIIARRQRNSSGDHTFEYGWLNYKGDAARAQWRASLRNWMFEPAMHQRIIAALQRMVASDGGGSGGDE
jgi:hypothetical protein